MEKAVEFLREKGLAAMAKKANRIAAEGIVAVEVAEDSKAASIVEVNSETDFVAKNADFQAYVAKVAAQALDTKAENLEAFMAEAWLEDAGLTVEQALSQKIAVIGEKLSIRRFQKVTAENGVVTTYIHGRQERSDVVVDLRQQQMLQQSLNVVKMLQCRSQL